MISINKDENNLLFEYITEQEDASWVEETLDDKGEVYFKWRIFNFNNEHTNFTASKNYYQSGDATFLLGKLINDYYVIDKEILGLKHDLFLFKDMTINENTFIAKRHISIFRKIDKLIDEEIVIGGKKENAIPESDFKLLLKYFPTTTELDHYAGDRISRILKEYLNIATDPGLKLKKYLAKKKNIKMKSRVEILHKYEIEKYQYIYDNIEVMLNESESYSEYEWQKIMLDFILLLFPKYIAVLENLHIKDYYSNPQKTTNRYIDLTLVDANGNIDIIEIKKPFEKCLLSANTYRDNYTPKKELSGAIMQAEKYIFHLNKWGRNGEVEINKKRGNELPENIKLKITNPKSIIILGRDNNFKNNEKFDFEIIKRKYANVIDIITYDDLLLRLKNIINKFKKENK